MTRMTETDAVVEAMIAARSVKETADLLGISPRTLHRRLRQPEVQQALDETRRELLRASLVRLHALLSESMDAIERCLNESQPVGVQLQAAKVVIENTYRSLDAFDLDSRLRALEAQQQAQQQHPRPLQSYLPDYETKADD